MQLQFKTMGHKLNTKQGQSSDFFKLHLIKIDIS